VVGSFFGLMVPAVWADTKGEVYWWTAELEIFSVDNVSPEIFTKVLERIARNPQLEAIQAVMRSNQDRRDKKQEKELAAFRAQIEAQRLELEKLKPAPVPAPAPEPVA